MAWEMQVKTKTIQNGKPVYVFESVRCSGKEGYTYRYPTRHKAKQALDSCYPTVIPEMKRIIEVKESANMT